MNPCISVMTNKNGVRLEHVPAYAIWCNEKTGQVTVRSETGYYTYSPAEIESITFK